TAIALEFGASCLESPAYGYQIDSGHRLLRPGHEHKLPGLRHYRLLLRSVRAAGAYGVPIGVTNQGFYFLPVRQFLLSPFQALLVIPAYYSAMLSTSSPQRSRSIPAPSLVAKLAEW